MKKPATATLLPAREGSKVVVAIIFNFYRIYIKEAWSISVIVKSIKKVIKWNVTLTLIDQIRKSIINLKIFLKNF